MKHSSKCSNPQQGRNDRRTRRDLNTINSFVQYWEGPGVPKSLKSLVFRVLMVQPRATFTDDEGSGGGADRGPVSGGPSASPHAADHPLLDLGHVVVGEESLLSTKAPHPPAGGI